MPLADSGSATVEVSLCELVDPAGRWRLLLNRRLFVYTQHNGLLGRRDIEADNIGGFGRKVRVVTLAPGLASLKVDLVPAQEPPDMLDINIAQRIGQQGPSPARKPFRRWFVQQPQNPFVGRLGIDRLLARPGACPSAPQGHGRHIDAVCWNAVTLPWADFWHRRHKRQVCSM
jgi:hypothetical protein